MLNWVKQKKSFITSGPGLVPLACVGNSVALVPLAYVMNKMDLVLLDYIR